MLFQVLKKIKITLQGYYITYIWNLTKPNSQKQRVEWWLLGAREQGIGEMMFKGTNLQTVDK